MSEKVRGSHAISHQPNRIKRRGVLIACILLALPWLVSRSLFSEYSAAPHNDDWLYGRSVQVLAEEGRYQHVSQHGELAASVVSHVYWGWLFVWEEFSFEALHLSQAVAGWLTCVGVMLVVLMLGGRLQFAILASVSLLICPLFFGHTFTFMTDVTALMFVTYALLCFICSDQCRRVGPLILGSVLTALVFWCRQTHAIIGVVPIYVLWANRASLTRRQMLLRLGILVGVPAISLLVFEWAGLVPGNESRTGTLFIKVFDLERLKQIAIYLYGTGLLLGMLLLPISSSVVLKLIKRQEVLINRWWIGLVCLLWAGVFVATGGRTYITQSVGYFLHNAHLGPVLFADPPHPDGSWTYLGDVKWIPLIWQILTLMSILSLAVCVALGFSGGQRRESGVSSFGIGPWRTGILLFCILVSLSLLAVVENIVDRHWLVLFVPAVIWVGTSPALEGFRRLGRASATLVWLAIFAIGYISMTFTHDWLAFNHQRNLQMHQWLSEEGLRPQDIDVGMDLNGWLRTSEDYASRQREGDLTRSWRGLATYALAHRPRKGWSVIGQRSWLSWAVETDQYLLLLKKDNAEGVENEAFTPTSKE
ncbi:MAG: hypothetical protein CMM06_07195 [Rhodopirellula sp.]|nr:hypothetical protein [Rhodopirellula sp.]|tara:strand:- start:7584 stop:9356 length:1773 start_codon:yes stop_codon:yes gene_type:complete